MNVIIPMAGRGKRFNDVGYSFPKPLIDVNGKPMIQIIIENLNLTGKHIFICQKEHIKKFAIYDLMNLLKPNSKIISVDKITQGAAETVLLAKDLINNDDELIIANSDQWIDWNNQHFLSFMRKKDADGGIVSFISTHPKWSYVRINDETSLVEEVAEKRPISNIATAGIYYYKHGKDFVAAAEQMIKKNIRTNNEFYVAPAFNEMISMHKIIHIYPIAEMRGLGTPEDLHQFINSPPKVVTNYD